MEYQIYKEIVDEAGNIGFVLIDSLDSLTDAILDLENLRSISDSKYTLELKDELGSHTLGL